LEEALEERAWMLVFLGVCPKMDPLGDDPRFEALRRKVEGPTGRRKPSSALDGRQH
jgi:hypothetical protein